MFLPAEGGAHLQHVDQFHQERVQETRIPGGDIPEHLQRQAVANFGTLGALRGKFEILTFDVSFIISERIFRKICSVSTWRRINTR